MALGEKQILSSLPLALPPPPPNSFHPGLFSIPTASPTVKSSQRLPFRRTWGWC